MPPIPKSQSSIQPSVWWPDFPSAKMDMLLSKEAESKEVGVRLCGVTVGVVEGFGGSAIEVSGEWEEPWMLIGEPSSGEWP